MMQLDEFEKLDVIEQWKVILSLSARMLESAKQSDWDQLHNMDALKRQLLETFFNHQLEKSFAEKVRQDIVHMLEVDKAIIEVVKSAQQVIPRQINRLNTGRKAATAYNQNC